jgi:mRNA-degrading endonuclease RelE of RelBE toxin-antitoxin system
MRLRFTERADKDYADLPANIRKAFAKQRIREELPYGTAINRL